MFSLSGIGAAIGQGLGALLSFAVSPIGRLGVAFLVGWIWSASVTNGTWRRKIAAEKAAAILAEQVEIARQAKANQSILTNFAANTAIDTSLLGALMKHVADVEKEEANEPATACPPAERVVVQRPAAPRPRACAIDDAYARRVQQFDSTAASPKFAKPARRVR